MAGTVGRVGEVVRVFGRLGWVGFGGPAAHIALLERETVARRGWLDRAEFLDLLAGVNLLPGPNSTELALLLARRRAGWRGLVAGGVAFILPAVLLTLLGAALLAMGVHELVALAVPGAFVVLSGSRRPAAAAVLPLGLAPAAAAPVGASLLALFGFFLKVGAVLYGSGYVLLAFLRGDLVERWHWLTDRQLVDAIAMGQATPGPVFSAATFVGYIVAGVPGAAVATVGIFLPAFVYALVGEPVIDWLRGAPTARRFLDGVVAGSVGLLLVVVVQLARAAVTGPLALAVVAAALLLRFKFHLNPAALLVGAALFGAVTGMLGLL